MPHDATGKPLKAGDVVTLRFAVQDVYAGEDACNVSLRAIGNEPYLPNLTCNSRLGVRADEPFQEGDRVYVLDPGLKQLRDIMSKGGGEVKPNHHGTVLEILPDDEDAQGSELLIGFDDEIAAPYPIHQVRHLPE